MNTKLRDIFDGHKTPHKKESTYTFYHLLFQKVKMIFAGLMIAKAVLCETITDIPLSR